VTKDSSFRNKTAGIRIIKRALAVLSAANLTSVDGISVMIEVHVDMGVVAAGLYWEGGVSEDDRQPWQHAGPMRLEQRGFQTSHWSQIERVDMGGSRHQQGNSPGNSPPDNTVVASLSNRP
jgi:hypothetical protein